MNLMIFSLELQLCLVCSKLSCYIFDWFAVSRLRIFSISKVTALLRWDKWCLVCVASPLKSLSLELEPPTLLIWVASHTWHSSPLLSALYMNNTARPANNDLWARCEGTDLYLLLPGIISNISISKWVYLKCSWFCGKPENIWTYKLSFHSVRQIS